MHLFNLPHTIANMFLFSKAAAGAAPRSRDLRAAYVAALIKAQRNGLSPELAISFGERTIGSGEPPAILRDYGVVSRVPADQQARIREQIASGLALLARLDRSLHDFVHLLVTDLVVLRGERSGAFTVGRHLGVVYLLPDPAWDDERWADTLLHEAIHLNVYLADLVHAIFVERDSLASPAALVPSAVREGAELRPFDGAFHSACVSVGIAFLRFLMGDDDRVAQLVTQLGPCVAALAARGRWLTPYGLAVLEQLQAFTAQPDVASLGRALTDRALAAFARAS